MQLTDKKIVLALVLVGLALRVYSAIYTPVSPYDEKMFMAMALGTSTSPWQRLATLFHGPIYFYVTDIAYQLLGSFNYYSGRFFPVIFSTASIALVYLVALELYGKRTALLSSAVFAVLAGAVIYGSRGLFEPIYTALVLLSFLLFIRWIKDGREKYLLAAAAFFGVASATKILAFYFLPLFAVYYLASGKKIGKKAGFEEIAKAAIVCVLLFSPVIFYNYFLYKDKGIVDFRVAQILNHGFSKEYFEGYNVSGISDPFIQIGLYGVPAALYDVFNEFTPLAVLFMLVGLASTAALQRKGEDAALLAWLLVPVALFTVYFRHDYYAAAIAPPIAILAARGMEAIALRLGKRSRARERAGILILFATVELYALASASPGISADEQLREFAASLPGGSIILTEPKIDTINEVFAFAKQDAYGITAQNLVEEILPKVDAAGAGQGATLNAYYVTCELENCWEDRSVGPYVQNKSKLYNGRILAESVKVKDIYENGRLVYSVYRVQGLPAGVANYLRKIVFFGMAIGAPELSDDVYALHGPVDNVLSAVAHASVYVGVALAFSAPVVAAYMFLRQKERRLKP